MVIFTFIAVIGVIIFLFFISFVGYYLMFKRTNREHIFTAANIEKLLYDALINDAGKKGLKGRLPIFCPILIF